VITPNEVIVPLCREPAVRATAERLADVTDEAVRPPVLTPVELKIPPVVMLDVADKVATVAVPVDRDPD
jgi:hypothetical protein